jgi:hypothetical protein
MIDATAGYRFRPAVTLFDHCSRKHEHYPAEFNAIGIVDNEPFGNECFQYPESFLPLGRRGRIALPAHSALALPCARAPLRREIIRGRKRSLANLNEHFARELSRA